MMRSFWALIALLFTFQVGCTPIDLDNGEDPDCTECPEPAGDSLYFATDRLVNGEAVINLEYIPNWGTPGEFGWHTQITDVSGEVALNVAQAFIEGAVSGEDFNFDEIECVRASISYGDDCEDNPNYDTCEWLCEGNGPDAALTTAVDFDWFNEDWSVGTWSDPGGEGCSLLACR